jgi:hypothetical protein
LKLDQGLRDYFRQNRVHLPSVCKADVILALLRMGRRPEAEELLGKPITVCPPAVPPWPPKPVEKPRARGPVVSKVKRNPFTLGTKAHEKYNRIQVGMTRNQVISKGITYQQVYHWRRDGYLKFEEVPK